MPAFRQLKTEPFTQTGLHPRLTVSISSGERSTMQPSLLLLSHFLAGHIAIVPSFVLVQRELENPVV
jgi:hypothetical protein